MSFRNRTKAIVTVIGSLVGMMMISGFLFPPEIRYRSYLEPVLSENTQNYTYDEETQTVSYDYGGSSVQVKYMTEEDLNILFPDESSNGVYSTNPYTYGDWINPEIGYTPQRFTTFQVTLFNRTFSKMRIDPVEATLQTDQGELLHSYTYSVAAAKYGNSFEDYYRRSRGMSGNDYYRYEMRMGLIRGKNYGLEENIFRGDSYSGLLTFSELRPEVKKVTLTINNITYRFDAFDRPAENTTAVINYNRITEKKIITAAMKEAELMKQKVRIRTTGQKQIINNRVNDNARSELTIDKMMQSLQPEFEKCFLDRYRKNEVKPGNMQVSFTIDRQGKITSQTVIQVNGIGSENFMNCVLRTIRGSQYEVIADLPSEGTGLVKGPALPVNVLYPLDFSVYIEGEEAE